MWRVDEVGGAASVHVVTAVGPMLVVVGEPGVEFGLELPQGGEEPPVEGGPPAFLQGGVVEAFAYGVVVG